MNVYLNFAKDYAPSSTYILNCKREITICPGLHFPTVWSDIQAKPYYRGKLTFPEGPCVLHKINMKTTDCKIIISFLPTLDLHLPIVYSDMQTKPYNAAVLTTPRREWVLCSISMKSRNVEILSFSVKVLIFPPIHQISNLHVEILGGHRNHSDQINKKILCLTPVNPKQMALMNRTLPNLYSYQTIYKWSLVYPICLLICILSTYLWLYLKMNSPYNKNMISFKCA